MRCLTSTLALLVMLGGCRSTVQPNDSLGFQATDATAGKGMPLTLGDGYTCALNKKGQGQCLGTRSSVGQGAKAGWQTLRAAGTTPVLRNLVARSTVTCAIGVKPPSLENRILCWQPQTARTSGGVDQDAIMLSGKLNVRLRSLALQKDQVCALLADGQVGCGSFHATGNALTLTLVKGLRSIKSIRSGESFSCGARADTGAIFCWGDNSVGQLGLGSSLREADEPVAIAGFSGLANVIEAGSQHVCAINHAGEVFCWGRNTEQQLGAQGQVLAEPQIIRGLPAKAEGLALGEKHSCAQLVNGSVWCWGAGEFLGSDTRGGLIPLKVPLPAAAISIVAGLDRSCAQLVNGEFACWASEPETLAIPN
ncbi:MAG TPA: hypothetical protein VE954_24190 [Oligoflexus sp.]|uniref:RCC1 domain-containing protein n=1 Tax=Oligoflexus sp. TaxID=1971216 RepID=UPI002D41C84F|nr:hypothetical protein [Oligoflexus sp.]HYX36215.1 hypothetical protein [Oligoflexus sp.]